MSVVWIVFVLITGRILATATLFADRFAAAARRPRRFVWLAGLIATVAWPAVAIVAFCVARLALVRGWGFGAPQNVPIVKLMVPRGVAPAWVDVSFLVLWACASGVLLFRLLACARAADRWRLSLPVGDVDGVRVRLSAAAGPAVIGVRTIDVLLPTWMLALDPSLRSLVLRHELEHRDARDPVLFWFAALLPALFPWNVFAWWQASRLRLALEMDCDARVMRADPRPVEYSRLLVSIAERWRHARALPSAMPALLGQGTRLEYRLAAIARRDVPTRRTRLVVYAVVAVAALCAALIIQTPFVPRVLKTLDALQPRQNVRPHASHFFGATS